MVIEDRIKFLYPYYSLCEENCTYSHIDFEIERIYCNCTLKFEFDLERKHQLIVNPYNNEEIKHKQKGPTNFPILQCISRLSDIKSYNNNGGFYYSISLLWFLKRVSYGKRNFVLIL